VLSRILAHAARVGRTEIGGFLIGRVDNQRLDITGATFPRQHGTATHVSITDEDMAVLAEELDRRGTGEVIVGWWHTHPGLGAGFMSGTDIATQERYQSLFPEAVALIVDPIRFIETLNLDDLDLHIYRVDEQQYQDLTFTYVHEPTEVIPDFYRLLLRMEEPVRLVLEETWFERMLRELVGQQVTTPEFTQHLGRFTEAILAFSVVGSILLITVISVVALTGW